MSSSIFAARRRSCRLPWDRDQMLARGAGAGDARVQPVNTTRLRAPAKLLLAVRLAVAAIRGTVWPAGDRPGQGAAGRTGGAPRCHRRGGVGWDPALLPSLSTLQRFSQRLKRLLGFVALALAGFTSSPSEMVASFSCPLSIAPASAVPSPLSASPQNDMKEANGWWQSCSRIRSRTAAVRRSERPAASRPGLPPCALLRAHGIASMLHGAW